jgi:hypothetical protein
MARSTPCLHAGRGGSTLRNDTPAGATPRTVQQAPLVGKGRNLGRDARRGERRIAEKPHLAASTWCERDNARPLEATV